MGGRPLSAVIVGIKFGILIRLDKPLFNLSSDMIFINVYIPPENSPGYDGERGSL